MSSPLSHQNRSAFAPAPSLVLLATLVACGGGSSTDNPDPVAGTVTVDAAAAKTATVGPDGATITTTDRRGVTYSLEVPAGAVPVEVDITMTPILEIVEIGLTGGLVAGVELKPSGLVFARPAFLHIGAPAPARSGFTLTGFSFEGDATTLAREVAGGTATSATVLVSHFSGAGIAYGTSQDLTGLTPPIDRPVSAQNLLNDVLAASAPGGNPLPPLLAYFDQYVLPLLEAATTDGQLIHALDEFEVFSEGIFGAIGDPLTAVEHAAEMETRRATWATALAPKLQDAIRGNNQWCQDQRSLAALRNVLFWQQQAAFYNVATTAAGLDRASVLNTLCARL